MKMGIKKYGINPYGADPNWVMERRLFELDEPIPNEWEQVTSTQYKQLMDGQKLAYESWLANLNTEIVSLDSNWQSKFTDFKQARTNLKTMIDAKGGFAQLSFSEKKVACKWFTVSPNDMMSFFVVDMGLNPMDALNLKITNSIFFNENSYRARLNRYNALFLFVRNVLERTDLNNISVDLFTYKFQDTYISVGREGTMKINYEGYADEIGIFDYILGTTEWTANVSPIRFEDRLTVPMYGLTKADVVNKCMDILDNGNY